ncbi:hypothetical protein [Microcystis sp. M061S2]|uniref:hypothetical protein n=1 Tax=Microcystis sp. M061S2 TaxID=2771171 RepID=UPI00258F6145|nr:hypothetical protein [Microcystis sp. M061S2]MCA2654522.1 hypothetical protein [Microcystis sp. M061S2]
MSTFKTPKGTELPFLNLKGKDYLQVAHRIVWFREERPDWSIETSIVEHSNDSALVLAEIKDPGGRTIARAHKSQLRAQFPGGYLEKAESGAVGRALAFLGYGTAFAQELEEDGEDLSQLADSPMQKPKIATKVETPKPIDANDPVIPFGKLKGKKVSEVKSDEALSYANWLEGESQKTGKPLSDTAKTVISAIRKTHDIPF